MPTPDGFPPTLLSQPAEARLAYFAGKVVAHPHLKQAHQALLTSIQQPADASLILVFGPTGVGKTTLRLRVEKHLLEAGVAHAPDDIGRIPVVAVEAVASETGQFNWKDYYTRALLALDEPLIAHKISYIGRGLHRDQEGRLKVDHTASAPELRRALEQCLHYRRLTALIVDEAQHFKKMASGRRLLDQMDTLKSLASLTGTVHVLVGTYDLLSLTDLSAQLTRRSLEIHFGRYRADVADDVLAFKSVLLTFQRHMPLSVEPDLVGCWEYLYEQSVGCVGVLKSWLYRALFGALDAGEPSLTRRRLEQHAAPPRHVLNLTREIQAGEVTWAEGRQGKTRPRLEQAAPARPASRSIGQRTPKRDPVGPGRADNDA